MKKIGNKSGLKHGLKAEEKIRGSVRKNHKKFINWIFSNFPQPTDSKSNSKRKLVTGKLFKFNKSLHKISYFLFFFMSNYFKRNSQKEENCTENKKENWVNSFNSINRWNISSRKSIEFILAQLLNRVCSQNSRNGCRFEAKLNSNHLN